MPSRSWRMGRPADGHRPGDHRSARQSYTSPCRTERVSAGPSAVNPASPTPTLPKRPNAPPERSKNGDAPQLRAGERKMLEVLAHHYPMKVTRVQLGTLAGYTASGGTFGAYFSTLKRHGLIRESSGEITIALAGFDYLGADMPAQPQTTEELLNLWRGVLRASERKMLDELVAIYPQALTREELGECAGYTASGGAFGAYLSTLRRNGLVEVDGDEVWASAALFLSSAVS